MALKDELEDKVREIFRNQWTTREGGVVPDDTSVKLGNDAVKISATVLYADLADSTVLVDTQPAWFAAEVYKSFLHCAAKIISGEGGVVTAYDGDRIMAVFIGKTKNTTATRCALKINWAAKNIVRTIQKENYQNVPYQIFHVCGIDTSDLFVAKTGIRGSNDLVWVGRAANYAAKLAALDHNRATWITKDVYDRLLDEDKYSNGVDIWVKNTWPQMNGMEICASTYWWKVK